MCWFSNICVTRINGRCWHDSDHYGSCPYAFDGCDFCWSPIPRGQRFRNGYELDFTVITLSVLDQSAE